MKQEIEWINVRNEKGKIIGCISKDMLNLIDNTIDEAWKSISDKMKKELIEGK